MHTREADSATNIPESRVKDSGQHDTLGKRKRDPESVTINNPLSPRGSKPHSPHPEFMTVYNPLSPGGSKPHSPHPEEEPVSKKPKTEANVTTPPPHDEILYSPKDDASHDENLDVITHISFVRRPSEEYFDSLKIQKKLIRRLKELSEKERRYEDDLEMAELVYLLKLLISPSNPKLETFGKDAGKGAMLLLEGERLMTAGRDLLRSVIADMYVNFH
ncbi:hypothetical protein L1049_008051 [Liquidambar formosana]|uniref:Uncharacterized protein n=1 Tax=Liquidambar formosana TaxID=63359 RepID=A0AAP0S337_LIQFO